MNEKQLDIIRKLIELACNNNSENEANSAARTVCKMIKNDEFKLLNSHSGHPPIRPVPPRRSPFESDFSDPFVNMYEEIRNRARQAAERERKRQEDLLEKLRKEREKREKEEKEKKEPKFTQKEEPRQWNWGYNPSEAQEDFFRGRAYTRSWDFETNFRPEGPEKRQSKERVCSKCGLSVKTFRLKDEPYICGVCQWGDYTKG